MEVGALKCTIGALMFVLSRQNVWRSRRADAPRCVPFCSINKVSIFVKYSNIKLSPRCKIHQGVD